MKKLSRIAALLAAGALLFGAAGCSGGGSGSGDGDGDGSGGGGGGGSTVSENTVKGTYTVKDADLAGETLVFVGGKIYMRMDYSLGEEEGGESSGGSSAPDSTTQSNGKYTLTYESGETAHEPSYTFDKVGGDEFVADFMAAIGAGKTSYTFYLEVGTYAIANGKVTGTIIDDEDSYPVTAETDDAGHLKSFTGSSGGDDDTGIEATAFLWLAGDYMDEVDSDATVEISEEKAYGKVTAIGSSSAAIKITNKGDNKLTPTDGTERSVTGYFQLSKGGNKDRTALKFAVPANTTKVQVFCKNAGSNEAKVTASNGTTEFYSEVAPSNSAYAWVDITPSSLTAATTIYLYNTGTGSGLNVKAIEVVAD